MGPSLSTATCHATAVSLASAGRITRSPGIARTAASCSMGWCVGPSSPRPTESCVQTKTTLAWLTAASRTAAPHVVAEHEERAADGEHAAVHGHAVHRRGHAVLADAEVDLAAGRFSGGLHAVVLDDGPGVAGEVGAAGHESGHDVDEGVDARAVGAAGGDLVAHRPGRQLASHPSMPVAAEARVPRGAVDVERRQPLLPLLAHGPVPRAPASR